MYDAKLRRGQAENDLAWELSNGAKRIALFTLTDMFGKTPSASDKKFFASLDYGLSFVRMLNKYGAEKLIPKLAGMFPRKPLPVTTEPLMEKENLPKPDKDLQEALRDVSHEISPETTLPYPYRDPYFASVFASIEESMGNEPEVDRSFLDDLDQIKTSLRVLTTMSADRISELVDSKKVQNEVTRLQKIYPSFSVVDQYLRAIQELGEDQPSNDYRDDEDDLSTQEKKTGTQEVEEVPFKTGAVVRLKSGSKDVIQKVMRHKLSGKLYYRLQKSSQMVPHAEVQATAFPIVKMPSWLSPALKTAWFAAYEKAKQEGNPSYGFILEQVENYAKASGIPFKSPEQAAV